jgi:hypothetical protein
VDPSPAIAASRIPILHGPCDSAGEATHNFGTTDLATLARVSAFAQSTLNANETEAQVPIRFEGSVAVVDCDSDSAVITFVVEPE